MIGAVDSATLWLFSSAVLVLLASPGPNMAFILAHGMALGPRGGVAAAAGIGCADLVMTLLTVLGITAAIAAWPPSFDVLRYAGTAGKMTGHCALNSLHTSPMLREKQRPGR